MSRTSDIFLLSLSAKRPVPAGKTHDYDGRNDYYLLLYRHADRHRLSVGADPEPQRCGSERNITGVDIREHGSKNAGTNIFNMLRVLGKRAALPVFGPDFLKGFVAVTILDLMKYDSFFEGGANEFPGSMCCASPPCWPPCWGHIFPIFAGFRPRKGVATLVGAITGINAPLVLLCFASGSWC